MKTVPREVFMFSYIIERKLLFVCAHRVLRKARVFIGPGSASGRLGEGAACFGPTLGRRTLNCYLMLAGVFL